MSKLREFVRESNRIEGIVRDPETYEIEAHERLLGCHCLTLRSVEEFVFDICGRRLRRRVGMDLHPFMDGNGRSGRAIWNWQMQREGRDPYALQFLHCWYYQSLEESRIEAGD